jgi:hypothetical protein
LEKAGGVTLSGGHKLGICSGNFGTRHGHLLARIGIREKDHADNLYRPLPHAPPRQEDNNNHSQQTQDDNRCDPGHYFAMSRHPAMIFSALTKFAYFHRLEF